MRGTTVCASLLLVIWTSIALPAAAQSNIRAAESHCNDRPDWPGETLVKNSDDAKRIAFAMWHAANPNFQTDNEKSWAIGFDARLDRCIWKISLKPDGTRRTLKISIGAVDGRFLGTTIGD